MARATEYIECFYKGQMRKSREPFYYHLIAVAHILLPFTTEQDMLIAARLHDTVKNTTLIGFLHNLVTRLLTHKLYRSYARSLMFCKHLEFS